MEVQNNYIIEAIAEWFMQLFFDPMYHFISESNDYEQTKRSQITKVKKNVSDIWYKVKKAVHYLFIKEKIHETILQSLLQDINQTIQRTMNQLTLYGNQLRFNEGFFPFINLSSINYKSQV